MEINQGYPPLDERPLNSSKDPHSQAIQSDGLFVNHLHEFPVLCTLLDCLSTGDLPSLNIHKELYLYVPHVKLPSLSYYGGKPSDFNGKILYKINAVMFQRNAGDSRLVVTPLRAKDGTKGQRASLIRNHPQIYQIKNLLAWAAPDQVLFFNVNPWKD